MVHTDETMAEILAFSDGNRSDVAGSLQRRAHDRITKTGTLNIFPCRGKAVGRSLQVSLRDVSRGGIGLISPQQLDPEGGFIVALKRGAGKATVLLYVIRRQIAEPDGFHIGAQLEIILRDNEIRFDDDSPLHRVGRATLRAAAAANGP